MFHTAKYAITYLNFVHFDTSAIQIRKRKVSNPPRKSRFVTYIDVSLNLEIICVIHRFVSYSPPNHYDILLSIGPNHIVNMDAIRSSIRFVRIHMCLLSFLKRYLTFKIISEIPTRREFILLILTKRVNPKNYEIMGTDIYVHPTINIYVQIYMQYMPRIMKTNMRLHHSI